MELFRGRELSEEFENRKSNIKQEIMRLSDDDVMSGQDDKIINNIYEKYNIVPIDIEAEVKENQDLQRVQIQQANPFPGVYMQDYNLIDGVKLTSTFPFTGDNLIFTSRASTFSISPLPNVSIYPGYITLSAEETLNIMNKPENTDLLFKRINHDIECLKRFVGYGNRDVMEFNFSIRQEAKTLLDNRKDKISKFYNISKMLNIPIVKSNPKVIEEIKIVRTIVPIVKRESNVNTDYSITDDIYSDILRMVKHQGSSFEGTPKSIASLNEENLRDLILSSLNAVFLGQAHGECFRKNGKTDISIEYDNRAAFVAECKFWGGAKILISALNQLLSYTTWRDNKLCLILFSKNKGFFKIIREIKQVLTHEEGYISLKELDKNEFEYKIKSKYNEEQVVTIRVFAFDLSIN